MEPNCAHGNRRFLLARRRLEALGVRGLPHVLKGVRKGADKPHAQRNRRVPAGVDDAVKVVCLRKSTPVLGTGTSRLLLSAGYPLVYLRGGTHLVVVNRLRRASRVKVDLPPDTTARHLVAAGYGSTAAWSPRTPSAAPSSNFPYPGGGLRFGRQASGRLHAPRTMRISGAFSLPAPTGGPAAVLAVGAGHGNSRPCRSSATGG